MTLNRRQLARIIDAGRASTLNCFKTTQDLAAIGAEIADDDPTGPLFRNRHLNRTIVIKVVEFGMRGKRRIHHVETLLYFPYNDDNVYEGGDSVTYSDPRRDEKLNHKCGIDPGDERRRDDIAWDRQIIDMLASLPTLDPFLLKCRAQQVKIDEKIHDSYFNISLEEWQSIQGPIRSKIDTLVRKSFGDTPEGGSQEIDRHVTRFLRKIWEARDVEGIEDFVRGLGIPLDEAPELFFAWKAIAYYAVRFRQTEPALKRLFAWIGDPRTSVPIDHSALPVTERDLKMLRGRLRDNYKEIASIIQIYEDSYRAFVEDGRPDQFRQFLGRADVHYNDLAACLSANSHAIDLVEHQRGLWADQIPSDHHRELLDSLLSFFGIETGEPAIAG